MPCYMSNDIDEGVDIELKAIKHTLASVFDRPV